MAEAMIALAGATGDLGGRIARALVARGATVRALVRPDVDGERLSSLTAIGVQPVAADPGSVSELAVALSGVSCVVSTLNGLREVVIDRQSRLLEAAVRAGVPRFVPSDFAADFTHTRPGDNRNYDLRREFMARVDRSPIRATSVLNGAFMDMLGAEMPIIQPRVRRVLYWRDKHQLLDFTTKDDTAAFTAAAAIDEEAPRVLRIAGDVVSAADLARIMSTITGDRYRTLRAGGISSLSLMIRIARFAAPGGSDPFPAWQGMQYMRDQFSGDSKLFPLDNDRYPDLAWTTVANALTRRFQTGPGPESRQAKR